MSNSTNTTKRVMTVKEAAAYTGWTTHELYRRLERGQIPGATRVGERWVIRRDPLDRWLQGEDSK